ncbi:LamG-like jellyroll fold domain-containing protein [Patescibacteria group bacterium]
MELNQVQKLLKTFLLIILLSFVFNSFKGPQSLVGQVEAYSDYIIAKTIEDYRFGNFDGDLTPYDPVEHPFSNHADNNPEKAIVVEWHDFDGFDYRFVFWHEASYVPFWEFSDGTGLNYQFFEGADNCGELFNKYGRREANSYVQILESGPDRAKIKWDYFCTNKNTGERVGHGIEYYTFLRNGLGLREMAYIPLPPDFCGSFEPMEMMVMNPRGTYWWDNVPVFQSPDKYKTYTLLDVDSSKYRYGTAKPNLADHNNVRVEDIEEFGDSLADMEMAENLIVRVHMNNLDPFTIYGSSTGITNAREEIKEVGSWGYPHFVHWPIGWINDEWKEGTRTEIAYYPSHTSVIGVNHPWEGQLMRWLIGVTDAPDEVLRDLGQEWLQNPSQIPSTFNSARIAGRVHSPEGEGQYWSSTCSAGCVDCQLAESMQIVCDSLWGDDVTVSWACDNSGQAYFVTDYVFEAGDVPLCTITGLPEGYYCQDGCRGTPGLIQDGTNDYWVEIGLIEPAQPDCLEMYVDDPSPIVQGTFTTFHARAIAMEPEIGIMDVDFYYAPTSSSNLCDPGVWTLFSSVPAGPEWFRTSYDTSKIPPGEYYVIANPWDEYDGTCSANPAAPCDGEAVCTDCLLTVEIVGGSEPTPIPTVTPIPSPDDPETHYLFNNNPDDSTGNNHTASMLPLTDGATYYTASPFEGPASLLLDGVNDYVNLPETIFDTATDFTFAAWVYWQEDKTNRKLFNFGYNSNNSLVLTPKSGATNKMRFYVRHLGVTYGQINGSQALPSDSWHHVAVTLGSKQAVLYLDGVEIGRNDNTSYDIGDLNMVDNYLGKSMFGDPYFKGYMDDVRIYLAGLSDSQIQELATSSEPSPTPPDGICPADVDDNGQVNANDFRLVLDAYHQDLGNYDIHPDSQVNLLDISQVIVDWGADCTVTGSQTNPIPTPTRTQPTDLVCASYFRKIDTERMIQGTWTDDSVATGSIPACFNWMDINILNQPYCAQPEGQFITIALIDVEKHTYDMPEIDMSTEFVHSQFCPIPTPTRIQPIPEPTPTRIQPCSDCDQWCDETFGNPCSVCNGVQLECLCPPGMVCAGFQGRCLNPNCPEDISCLCQ